MTDVPESVATAVDGYFAAWNSSTDDRAAAVAAAFTADAYYCDGAAEASGTAEIVQMMDEVMQQFAGSSFALSSPIDAHHQQARFGWRMTGEDGAVVIEGIDAVRFVDGRISTALGFFGVDLPEPVSEVPARAHTT